jgi:hypothetical protein
MIFTSINLSCVTADSFRALLGTDSSHDRPLGLSQNAPESLAAIQPESGSQQICLGTVNGTSFLKMLKY